MATVIDLKANLDSIDLRFEEFFRPVFDRAIEVGREKFDMRNQVKVLAAICTWYKANAYNPKINEIAREVATLLYWTDKGSNKAHEIEGIENHEENDGDWGEDDYNSEALFQILETFNRAMTGKETGIFSDDDEAEA